MIKESVVKQLGIRIYPNSQIATQADGNLKLEIVGEVHFNVERDNFLLKFEGLVARSLDADVLAGIPFCIQNNISLHPATSSVQIQETPYPYDFTSRKPSVSRIQTAIARSSSESKTIWPGDFVDASCDIDPSIDVEVAVEPSWSKMIPSVPIITHCLQGKIRLVNNSDQPIHVSKNQHIAHVVRTINPEDMPIIPITTDIPAKENSKHNSDLVKINPDKMQECSSWEKAYSDLPKDFEHVFSDTLPGYNGKSGNIEACVNISNCLPPQRKGRVPLYSRDKLVELQYLFDSLENLKIFGKPEDSNVNVEYVNPSFLVKKSDGGFRLVTSFGEVAKHCKPVPSLMPDVEATLRQIGQWKYLIKSDLTKAYFQIPLKHSSQKYCGVVTPFKGIRIYKRCAMGMPGSESILEELMSRILGKLIVEGKCVKIADDLYCGSEDSLEDLFSSWSQVVRLLSDNDLRLSAPKTIILPRSTVVLGWIWNQGTLAASSHQISPLVRAEPPKTVKELRSFVGSFRSLSKVIENASKIVAPLESLAAGRQSSEKISLSESSLACFNNVKECLKSTKIIHIPKRSDHLWIVTDGAVKSSGIGATLYITRSDKNRPLLAGFFSSKLKQHQPRWLPCEVEALAISTACNHFRPYIIQSIHQTHVLTDSRPCVQAYYKLNRGEFSTSARVQTFLTIVNNLNVSVQHVSGTSNIVADYASRNAAPCYSSDCQICKFISESESSVVFSLGSVEEKIQSLIPYGDRSAWKSIQSSCPSISQAIFHLKQGTRPSKKCTKINDTKRYLRESTLARDGLLVVKSHGIFTEPTDRFVVPRNMLQAILTSIHLKGNHPTPHQLKMTFRRNFAALDLDRAIQENVDGCHICSSVKHLPKHITEFSTSPPDHVGQRFAIDVLRRCKQFILIARESLSSFTCATMIKSEKAEHLLDGVATLLVPIHPFNGPHSTIRIDPAPGFRSLFFSQPLSSKGLLFDLGRVKNPNKNPIAEKAVRELQDELIRMDPMGTPISSCQLSFAIATLNSRIRYHGLSAYEVMFGRNQFTASKIPIDESKIITAQQEARLENHQASLKSQSSPLSGKLNESYSNSKKGLFIYLKND